MGEICDARIGVNPQGYAVANISCYNRNVGIVALQMAVHDHPLNNNNQRVARFWIGDNEQEDVIDVPYRALDGMYYTYLAHQNKDDIIVVIVPVSFCYWQD